MRWRTRVARAVPLVIDCDQVAVVLIDPATEAAETAAYGLPPAIEAKLLEARFLVPLTQPAEWSLVCDDRTSAALDPTLADYLRRTQAEAIASFPIAANGELIGWIVVGVTNGPERLRHSTNLEERLRGLAGQAATAICNARLLDQIRHQALHDALTGLPNRALILDRAEQMLERARRHRRPRRCSSTSTASRTSTTPWAMPSATSCCRRSPARLCGHPARQRHRSAGSAATSSSSWSTAPP